MGARKTRDEGFGNAEGRSMGFDILAWALGFGLSRVAKEALDKRAKSLSHALRKAVIAWAKKLPKVRPGGGHVRERVWESGIKDGQG